MTAGQRASTGGDRLKQFRAFCHAARLGSISHAAERIYSSQPAVSQQIRALEDELGVVLFNRNGPRISLSQAGRWLYQAAMPIVAGMDRLPDTFVEQHHGEVSDEFRIAAGRACAARVVPDYLRRFRESYPDVRVKVMTGTGRERLSWIRAWEVDIAFGAVAVPPPDLEFRFLFASSYVIITPENHPLAGRDSVGFAEAASYPAVMVGGDSYTSRAVDTMAWQLDVTPSYVLEVDGWSVIKCCVEAGVGISVVPDFCVTDQDRVWSIPVDQFFPDRRYGVFTRRFWPPSLAAEEFIRLMEPDFRSLPQ